MDDDPLLTVPEIGKKLRVTEWTVREWIKTGKLHGWRAGMRRYRVPQSEFKRFLREREAPGPQTQEAVRTRVTGLGSPMTVDHALPQIHTAENRWHQTLAQHRQAPPDRGFAARLADQADACRKMEKAHASLAEFGLTFDPLPPGIREPPYELRSDSGRGGPPELWERFDRATVKLSEASRSGARGICCITPRMSQFGRSPLPGDE